MPTPDEVFASNPMLEKLKPSDLSSEGLESRIIHVLDGLKTQLRNELEEIAGPAKASRKLQKQEMSDLICSLCNGHYLGLKVLAALLDRSENYLRQSQLNPLVEQGRLRRAFPTTPNDPRQAYTSSKQ
ncbi:MAG: hypothetical protein RBR67_12925 [Desulfobacterium sp.]|nr:hypothetical protein [Desulfobacterium sp.]